MTDEAYRAAARYWEEKDADSVKLAPDRLLPARVLLPARIRIRTPLRLIPSAQRPTRRCRSIFRIS